MYMPVYVSYSKSMCITANLEQSMLINTMRAPKTKIFGYEN